MNPFSNNRPYETTIFLCNRQSRQHLVYASVGSADRKTGIPHREIKWQIEQHIRELDLPFTVLRPTMFMENHADPKWGLTGDHALLRTIPSNAKVQLIALTDIGAFAALAFANPERYLGKAIELAGDELTRDQIITTISRATGRTLPVAAAPQELAAKSRFGAEGGEGVVSFCGWQADIPALRALYPPLMNFDTWLAQGGAAMIEKLF